MFDESKEVPSSSNLVTCKILNKANQPTVGIYNKPESSADESVFIFFIDAAPYIGCGSRDIPGISSQFKWCEVFVLILDPYSRM